MVGWWLLSMHVAAFCLWVNVLNLLYIYISTLCCIFSNLRSPGSIWDVWFGVSKYCWIGMIKAYGHRRYFALPIYCPQTTKLNFWIGYSLFSSKITSIVVPHYWSRVERYMLTSRHWIWKGIFYLVVSPQLNYFGRLNCILIGQLVYFFIHSLEKSYLCNRKGKRNRCK